MAGIPEKVDLHIHTTVSDGTDTPEELLGKIKAEDITVFSITDHDAVKGCILLADRIKDENVRFITGVEFSCRDAEGKYHILGYGYDPDAESVRNLVDRGHNIRMNKVTRRIDLLKEEYGFDFPEEEIEKLLARDNPGKPHIANLMVKYGYAENKEDAIFRFIDKLRFKKEHIPPEDAIRSIIDAGGIPVLAHPPYGSGNELIMGDELDARVKKLMGFGLKGVESYYSGFSNLMRDNVLSIAKKYGLYTTAGSDYHGKNKLVLLGDTGIDENAGVPEGVMKFIDDCLSLR